MHTPPTGTVTFLFTDIEGSTKLWEQYPDAMRGALARHDLLLRRSIEGHGGHVFKTVGDAFCAAFATAPDALAAALDAQQAVAGEDWAEGARLRVRMALHTGAAEERGGDYFGPPLNRTARLMAAAHGGQTLLSLATQELARDGLPQGGGLRDLGDARLKDLARPERVFQLLHPALPDEFPPLRTLESSPNNLPQQPTSFVGREKELAEIKALLETTRLLTLTGAGGSGKTRLALQAAADLLTGDGDGVWLVELAALSQPDLAPRAVADALGVREEAGRPLPRTLADALRSKRLLIVLDNCEHLIAACAALAAELLKACPGVRLLATSREPLNAAGERTYRVPSLTLPAPTQAHTVESLSQYEAVRLFIERAQAVQPSFTVSDANAPAVAQVCFHLDGIPLAIELAAARVRSLSVGEVSARLGDRFRLLTGGARTLLPRQQTLRALVDWSFDLLTEPERALLRRLSVFAGGWTLPAAEAVCPGADVEDWEVLDLLTGLVDKSLAVAESQRDGTRYRLPETIRQYAAEKLRQAGEEETGGTRDRHRTWCLTLAEEAEPQLKGPGQAAWLSRLEADHDNLRAALDWCAAPVSEAPHRDDGLRLAAALAPFWRARGHLREGYDRCLALLTRPEAAPRTAARAAALNRAGEIAALLAAYREAEDLHREALSIARELRHVPGEADALLGLGVVHFWRQDYADAARSLDESLTLRRSHGGEWDAEHHRIWGEGATLHNLGSLAMRHGEYAEAVSCYERALALRRRQGDTLAAAATLGGLGQAARASGDDDRASRYTLEALQLFDEAGQRWTVALCLSDLSQAAEARGDIARAVRLLAAAAALRERFHFPHPPAEREGNARREAAMRSRLGDASFDAAWAEGTTLPWEQVLEQARTP